MGQAHSCPALYGAGPQLPGHLRGSPTVAPPVAGHYRKEEPQLARSDTAHTPRAPRADGGGILRRHAFSGHGAASGEPLVQHAPSRFVAAVSGGGVQPRLRRLQRGAASHRHLRGLKGWAVGRYSVVLTRGEVLDALGEEWQVDGGKICDVEFNYLIWKVPASRRRRRRAD